MDTARRTEEKGGGMKLVYIAASGPADPTRASLPFHLAANGSVEAGQQTAVVLAGDAADIVVGDHADTIEGVGVPPMRELLAKLVDNSVPVYV
jgi:predicted peroxiredoxin